MKYEDLLSQALEIEPPWQIVRMRNDLGRRQLDVWVAREAPRRAWIFGARHEVPDGPERVWRHINVGQSRCVVHAAATVDMAHMALPWIGTDEQVFTHALSRQIATHFMEGISFQAICKLLDIPVGDLWKFKHSLDNGRISLSGKDALMADSGQVKSGVPDVDHPVWTALLTGALDLDIRALSLKLLLTKLRGQMPLISDPEVRLMKAHELHHYFVRHAAQLSHELTQLRPNGSPAERTHEM